MQVTAVNLTGKDFTKLMDAKQQHDVFAMMVTGFKQPVVVGAYVVAMFLLFLHLSHGVGAMFQSLGWKNPAHGPLIARFAEIISWFIFLGYISIPIAILLGYGSSYEGLTK